MLKRLYPYMKPCAGYFYLAVFLLLLDMMANIAIPWVTGQIIDKVFQASSTSWELRRETLYHLLLLLISCFIVLLLCIYLRGLALEWFSQKTMHSLRMALFNHMQKLDMGFYHQNTVGELMSRVTGDIEQLRNYCAHGLIALVFNFLFFPTAAIYMLYLNWQLTLLCLIVSPFIGFLAVRFSKINKRNQAYNRKAYAKLSAVAQESLNGIRVIQNFMSQDYEAKRFLESNRELTEGRYRALGNWAKYVPVLEVLGSFSNILALTVGGYMAIRGDFSLGTWIQFTGYTWMLVMPMREQGNLISSINFAKVASERLFRILDEEPKISSPEMESYIPKQTLPEGLHSINQLPGGQIIQTYPQGKGEIEFIHASWYGSDTIKKKMNERQY